MLEYWVNYFKSTFYDEKINTDGPWIKVKMYSCVCMNIKCLYRWETEKLISGCPMCNSGYLATMYEPLIQGENDV